MKRKIFIICLAVVLLLFSACDSNVNENTNAPDSGKSLTVPVPVFGSVQTDSAIHSRGITNMPLNEFKGMNTPELTSNLARKVMLTMPAMTSISPVEVDISVDNFGIDAIYSVYGFKIALNPFSSSVNEDGIYLNYDIYESMDSDTKVGFASYYYNTVDKKFTYRQAVVVTIPEEALGVSINLLIVLEYKDVDYDIFSKEFSVGQLTEDGTLDDNSICDILFLGDTLNNNVDSIKLDRRHITMQAANNVTAAFMQPDYEFISQQLKWEDTQKLKAIMEGIRVDSDYTINKDQERKNADVDFALALIEAIYQNGKSLSHHLKNNTKYITYQDFINDSIDKVELFDISNKRKTSSSTEFSIYNTKTKEGAASISSNVSSLGMTTGDSINDYELFNFDAFYEIDDETKTQYDEYNGSGNKGEVIWNFLVDQHLRACGITNTEYIEAFKKVAIGTQIESDEYPDRIRIEKQ